MVDFVMIVTTTSSLPLVSPNNHVLAAIDDAAKVMVPNQRTIAIVDAFASLKKSPSSIEYKYQITVFEGGPIVVDAMSCGNQFLGCMASSWYFLWNVFDE